MTTCSLVVLLFADFPAGVRFPEASFLYTNRSQSFVESAHEMLIVTDPSPSPAPIVNG